MPHGPGHRVGSARARGGGKDYLSFLNAYFSIEGKFFGKGAAAFCFLASHDRFATCFLLAVVAIIFGVFILFRIFAFFLRIVFDIVFVLGRAGIFILFRIFAFFLRIVFVQIFFLVIILGVSGLG